MGQEIPDILTLINKERFRRKLLISSRFLGFLLVLAIFWIGFIQIKYVNEVNEIKAEYGALGYCYMCGLETGRSCSCNYIPDLILQDKDFDYESYFKIIATNNIIECENRNDDTVNLSDIKIRQ